MNIKSIQELILDLFNRKTPLTKGDILDEMLQNNDDNKIYDEYYYTVANLLEDFCNKNILFKEGKSPDEKFYLVADKNLKPKEVSEEQLSVFLNDSKKDTPNKINPKESSNNINVESSKNDLDDLNKLYYIEAIKGYNTKISYLSEYLNDLQEEIDSFINSLVRIKNPEAVLDLNEFLLYVNINKILIRKQEGVENIMKQIKNDKEYIKNKDLLKFSESLVEEIDELLLKTEEKLPNRRIEREFELNASEEEIAWYHEFLDYTFRMEDLKETLRKDGEHNE